MSCYHPESPPYEPADRKRSAFTLVEVLVVMAIIAILIALLMPAIAQARYQARQTVCMSNQRQIVAAMIAYATDSEGFFPRQDYPLGAGDSPPTVTYAFWNQMTGRYGVNQKIMFCPFEPQEDVDQYRYFWFPMFGYGLWVPRSDQSNTGVFPPGKLAPGNCTILDPTGFTAGPTKIDDLARVSTIPILTDVATSVMPVPPTGMIDYPNVGFYGWPGGFYHFDPTHRVGAINEGYGDGHVESKPARSLTVRYTQGPFATWR